LPELDREHTLAFEVWLFVNKPNEPVKEMNNLRVIKITPCPGASILVRGQPQNSKIIDKSSIR
jgi:hypothetical protein